MAVLEEERVFIKEVAPRDGFQIEPVWIETSDKTAFINALSGSGATKIEVSPFVSAKVIPNLRDTGKVFSGTGRLPEVNYVALVPNLKGAERALAARVDEFNFVMSASETHNRANMRMSCAE